MLSKSGIYLRFSSGTTVKETQQEGASVNYSGHKNGGSCIEEEETLIN